MRKYIRWVVAVFAVAFTAFVARQLKTRTPEQAPPHVARADPKALVESTAGHSFRFDAKFSTFGPNV